MEAEVDEELKDEVEGVKEEKRVKEKVRKGRG